MNHTTTLTIAKRFLCDQCTLEGRMIDSPYKLIDTAIAYAVEITQAFTASYTKLVSALQRFIACDLPHRLEQDRLYGTVEANQDSSESVRLY